MTAWVLVNSESGALQQVLLNDPEDLGLPLDGLDVVEMDTAPDLRAWAWDAVARDFVPYTPPRFVTGLQILGLYTAAQTARANRMLTAVYPPQHPWAGQYVDPEGMTQRLINVTTALKEAIPVDGEFHQQGTAWMRLIGVIESDEEAARIAAGITPEEAAGL